MAVLLTVLLTTLAGCGVGDDSGEELSDDQALVLELFDGWPAPPEMYEVRDLQCVKLDDRVEVTATIVNTNDFAWAFGVEWVFHTVDGEEIPSRTDPGYWEPGQEVELSSWMAPPEDFDDEPRCEVNVYHGADLAFRPQEQRARTYERLGWDPETEQRIDGS